MRFFFSFYLIFSSLLSFAAVQPKTMIAGLGKGSLTDGGKAGLVLQFSHRSGKKMLQYFLRSLRRESQWASKLFDAEFLTSVEVVLDDNGQPYEFRLIGRLIKEGKNFVVEHPLFPSGLEVFWARKMVLKPGDVVSFQVEKNSWRSSKYASSLKQVTNFDDPEKLYPIRFTYNSWSKRIDFRHPPSSEWSSTWMSGNDLQLRKLSWRERLLSCSRELPLLVEINHLGRIDSLRVLRKVVERPSEGSPLAFGKVPGLVSKKIAFSEEDCQEDAWEILTAPQVRKNLWFSGEFEVSGARKDQFMLSQVRLVSVDQLKILGLLKGR